jgi:hypothetical protein
MDISPFRQILAKQPDLLQDSWELRLAFSRLDSGNWEF